MGSKLSSSKAAAVVAREDQGQTVEVRDELGNPILDDDTQKPFTITVVGAHSSVYRRALTTVGRRRANAKGAEQDRAQTEFVAACILGWSELVFDEQPFSYSKENAVTLLTTFPWIERTLAEAMHDHEGFTRAFSKS